MFVCVCIFQQNECVKIKDDKVDNEKNMWWYTNEFAMSTKTHS